LLIIKGRLKLNGAMGSKKWFIWAEESVYSPLKKLSKVA